MDSLGGMTTCHMLDIHLAPSPNSPLSDATVHGAASWVAGTRDVAKMIFDNTEMSSLSGSIQNRAHNRNVSDRWP